MGSKIKRYRVVVYVRPIEVSVGAVSMSAAKRKAYNKLRNVPIIRKVDRKDTSVQEIDW